MTDLQYITNASGQKTAVILPIDDFEAMVANFERFVDEVDDPELTAAMQEAENAPRVSFERVLEVLRKEN